VPHGHKNSFKTWVVGCRILGGFSGVGGAWKGKAFFLPQPRNFTNMHTGSKEELCSPVHRDHNISFTSKLFYRLRRDLC